MPENIVTKSVVSVTEMAAMVGLSRARFYQLVRRGTFPAADHDIVSNRPCYSEEKQRQILEARRRNCGVDGRAILFYSRRRDLGQIKAPARPKKQKAASSQCAELIDYLEEAKITMTTAEVETMLTEEFPEGTDNTAFDAIIEKILERRRHKKPSGSR